MMNFFTKLLTPVFIALGLVNPTPVIETPTQDTLLQREVIELRQKVEELQGGENIEITEDPKKEEVVTTKLPSSVKEVIEQPKPTPEVNLSIESKEQVLAPIKFEFKNIEAKANKEEATINWSTTLPSESRLVIKKNNLVQDIFPSNTTDGINHTVTITGLSSSNSYPYELIAKNQDEEISTFNKFYTEREFIVKREGCIFIVEDTMGQPADSGRVYKVSARSDSVSFGTSEVVTDKNGEFEYCKNAKSIKITDSNNEVVYSF